jgi:hypothetical protein
VEERTGQGVMDIGRWNQGVERIGSAFVDYVIIYLPIYLVYQKSS